MFNGIRFAIPIPTLCPEERQRRRLMFRNEKKLYKRRCSATWKLILSIYDPNSELQVYEQKYWWSDNRDRYEHASDFNFDETFTQQFRRLVKKTPHISRQVLESENCEYTNHTWYSKNCYLSYVCSRSESALYSHWWLFSSNIIDSSHVDTSENIFNSIFIKKSSYIFDSTYIEWSKFCYSSCYLVWCSYCLECTNLVNVSYYYRNAKITPEEFDELVNKRYYKKEYLKHPIHPAIINYSCDWCYGNNLSECRESSFIFWSTQAERCKYWSCIVKPSDSCYDCDNVAGASSSIDSNSLWGKNIYYSLNARGSNANIYYCMYANWLQNCFWCIWLINNSYCILNKQYTKHDYEKTVAKIITHMQETWERGEFFDHWLSPFWYNETVAQEYFPLTREEALKRWYTRQDREYPINIPEWIETVLWVDLPVDIDEVDTWIFQKAIICEVSGKPFRIIKAELEFYKKHNISLPRKHPDVRHQERLLKRPWRTLHLRTCDKTWNEILSVYPENTPFDVYSEEAYRNEVYW